MSKKLDRLRPFRPVPVPRAENRNSAPDDPLAALLDQTGPQDAPPRNLRHLPAQAEGPGVSELAGDELEDVLSAVFNTGEERDPDAFDDSHFILTTDPADGQKRRRWKRSLVQYGSESHSDLDALFAAPSYGNRPDDLLPDFPDDDPFADFDDSLTDIMLGDGEDEDETPFAGSDTIPTGPGSASGTGFDDLAQTRRLRDTLLSGAAPSADRGPLDALLSLAVPPPVTTQDQTLPAAAQEPLKDPLDALLSLPPGPAEDTRPAAPVQAGEENLLDALLGQPVPDAVPVDHTEAGIMADQPVTPPAAPARPALKRAANAGAALRRSLIRPPASSRDSLLDSLLEAPSAAPAPAPAPAPALPAAEEEDVLDALLSGPASPGIISPEPEPDASTPQDDPLDLLLALPVTAETTARIPGDPVIAAVAPQEQDLRAVLLAHPVPAVPGPAAEPLPASPVTADAVLPLPAPVDPVQDMAPASQPQDAAISAVRPAPDAIDDLLTATALVMPDPHTRAGTPSVQSLQQTRDDDDSIDWVADLFSDDEDMTNPPVNLPATAEAGQAGRRSRKRAQGRSTTDTDSRTNALLADFGTDTDQRTIADVLDDDVLSDLLRDDTDDADLFLSPEDDVPPARRTAPGPATPAPKRRSEGMDDLDRLLGVGTARPTSATKWRTRIIWAVILGGLTWMAFLPYAFEVGGDFVIQPFDRAEARTRTDGEVTMISVAQGDWVEKDQILAVISNWDEERDVILNESDNARLRAELATLTQGASPEQITVAEEALRTAGVQVDITARNLARQETLFASGTIPEKELLAARDQHDLAIAMRNQAQAALDLVKAAASQTEVDAQLAAIARNDEELEYARLMLEYTNVRAPAAGQIVSDMTKVPVGAYLSTGSLFAQIEDNRTVIAEIELPEITIEEVEVGAKAELRLWSEPDRSIFGTVRAIAPRAEDSEFGPVIRVQVEVPNSEGDLSANMSGFGKITAGERPVWEVFSRAVYRFFTIEVWSWLP